jgi:hypothetical protein
MLRAEWTATMTLPYTTDGWPSSRPLYHAAYYKDETGITVVVSDWRDTLLFIVRRMYRDAAYEAAQHPTSVDRLLRLEVVRRLQHEDWENGVTYQIDDS